MSRLSKWFPFSVRDCIRTLAILAAATGLCLLLHKRDPGGVFAPMLFILAVLFVARVTDGYGYGVVASIVSVLLVNYIFTYPYFRFNFTLSGYPIEIASMLVVSVITSALTTQIKQQERLRREAENERMRGNLLRAVSHDLRTPLTAILGANSALLDHGEGLDEAQKRALLRQVNEDAQWLIRIVENLLAVTRIDGDGMPKIQKTPEAMEELVEAAVAKFQKRFPDHPVTVRVPDELLFVPVDALLIEQVMHNLLENTAHHAPNATRVALAVERVGDEAIVTVTDNGGGISPEVLPHLFEGSLPQDNRRRSMGIGLSVCAAIIRAHGGRMRAKNKDGGAVISFALPMKGESV